MQIWGSILLLVLLTTLSTWFLQNHELHAKFLEMLFFILLGMVSESPTSILDFSKKLSLWELFRHIFVSEVNALKQFRSSGKHLWSGESHQPMTQILEKYRDTPPIYFWKSMTWRSYSSPPIRIRMRLPFVSRCFAFVLVLLSFSAVREWRMIPDRSLLTSWTLDFRVFEILGFVSSSFLGMVVKCKFPSLNFAKEFRRFLG